MVCPQGLLHEHGHYTLCGTCAVHCFCGFATNLNWIPEIVVMIPASLSHYSLDGEDREGGEGVGRYCLPPWILQWIERVRRTARCVGRRRKGRTNCVGSEERLDEAPVQ